MRKLHHRPFHRPRRGLSPLTSQLSTRGAFTLIELIIVVLVLLILMTLTIALVGNVLDGGRTRGAARQIQTYFAGARDRAIYSASRTEGGGTPPRVGVRFLSNRALVVQNAAGNNVHRGFSGMVYIQELDPVQTFLRAYEKPPGSGQWVASQLTFDTTTGDPILPPLDPSNPTIAVGELINRGLIDVRREPWNPNPDDNTDFIAYYLHVTFDKKDATRKDYYVRFHATDLIDDGSGTLWLVEGELSALLPWRTTDLFSDPPEECNFHLLPSPLPNVEPRMFPTGTIVEIGSSVVGTAPRQGSAITRNVSLRNLSRADGSFDVMFNAQGVVDGALAAAGMLHLVVADLEDIERGFQVVHRNDQGTPTDFSDDTLEVGSPFIDANGDWSDGIVPLTDGGEPVFRQGDVRIVSLRTRTGSAYVSEVNPQIDNTSNRFIDPFGYAETGGEAN